MNTLAMVKGEHRFIFRYLSGQEHLLFRAITLCVFDTGDDEPGLEWADAVALYSALEHRMGRPAYGQMLKRVRTG